MHHCCPATGGKHNLQVRLAEAKNVRAKSRVRKGSQGLEAHDRVVHGHGKPEGKQTHTSRFKNQKAEASESAGVRGPGG